MEIKPYINADVNNAYVTVNHGNESLRFTISVFGRDSFRDDEDPGFDVFTEINAFWAQLDLVRQEQIFSVYRRINQEFDTIFGRENKFDHIRALIKELIDLHDHNALYEWLMIKSNIIIPDEAFKQEYVHSFDHNTSREKTYTRSDYTQLVTLSVLLRTLVPVWGEYISNTRQETGTLYKELSAFHLLESSYIVHLPSVSKLNIYIKSLVGQDCFDPRSILNGISSEDYPTWLMARVFMRRLCVGIVNGRNPRKNLCASIYKYVIQQVNSSESSFSDNVKDKGGNGVEEGGEKVSVLERYKLVTTQDVGSLVEIEYVIRDAMRNASKLSSEITADEVNSSLRTSNQLLSAPPPTEAQSTMLQWVFKPLASPDGIMYIPKHQVIQCLGVAEAILWKRGHKFLAVLITASVIQSDIGYINKNTPIAIPQALVEEMEKLYPFHRPVSSRSRTVKQVPLMVNTISEMTDLISRYSWRATCSDEKLMELFGNTNRRLQIPSDIKILLANCILEIGNRSWN